MRWGGPLVISHLVVETSSSRLYDLHEQPILCQYNNYVIAVTSSKSEHFLSKGECYGNS